MTPIPVSAAIDTFLKSADAPAALAGLGGLSSIPADLTGVNSVTSASGQSLVLGTGTFGPAVSFASATGIPSFSTDVHIDRNMYADSTAFALFAGTSRLDYYSGQLYPGTDNNQTLGITAQRWQKLLLGTSLRIGDGTSGPTIGASGTSPNENLDIAFTGTGGLTIGGGSPIKKVLNAVVGPSFSASAGVGFAEQSFTLTGTVVGDPVFIGPPAEGATFPKMTFIAWASAADEITIRCLTVDPTAAISTGVLFFSICVFQF